MLRGRAAGPTVPSLTDQCAAGLGSPRARSLARVLRDFEPAPSPVHLLRAGREPLPEKLRCFLDHAGAELRRRLADVPS